MSAYQIMQAAIADAMKDAECKVVWIYWTQDAYGAVQYHINPIQ